MAREFYIPIVIAVIVMVSAVADWAKTLEGMRRGLVMLRKLLPQFLLLIVLVSTILGIISQDTLARLLGHGSGIRGVLIAAGIGSVTLIPGPIAFPLAGMLVQRGVGYTTLAVFITTLMMVGVVTFPVEREYLGTGNALLRNLLSFVGALIIGLIMGMVL